MAYGMTLHSVHSYTYTYSRLAAHHLRCPVTAVFAVAAATPGGGGGGARAAAAALHLAIQSATASDFCFSHASKLAGPPVPTDDPGQTCGAVDERERDGADFSIASRVHSHGSQKEDHNQPQPLGSKATET